jgi:acyl-CoA synthetase (AMP-forming)/AMP-acid ligase II
VIHASPHPPVEIPDVPLDEYVLGKAAARGDAPALIDAPSGRTLTYAGLDALASGIAAGLQARGLEPGQVVGILAPNVPEYAAAFFGVARAGGTNTTINGLYTAAEIAQQLRSSGARFLFTVSAMLDRALPAAAEAGVEEVIAFDGGDGATALDDMIGPPDALRRPAIDPATALVSLPYSSGTTGLPKGVMLTHRNLVANIAQMTALVPSGPDEVIAGVLPFFHIYGQTVVLNCILREGSTVVTMPRFDFEAFLDMIQRYRVTRAYVVPPIVVGLAKHPAVERYDLRSLRMMNSGAAPLDAAVEEACCARVPIRLQQGYGLTEASPVTHCAPLGRPVIPGSIGDLLPNTEARVVAVGTHADADPGEPGELWVRGPQVMRGYLADERSTARTLDAEGWLHTGDIATFDVEHGWRIVDRLKELIKYKGYQVAPAMLEGVLLEHPAVADACVIPSPDEEAGEIPKAFIVLRAPLGVEELMTFVAERVAPHERIRALEVIDEIPKSASGKLLRRVLVERERARVAGAGQRR